GFLTCSEYDRADPVLRHPPACEWFDSPTKPAANRAASDVPAADVNAAAVGAPLFAATGGLILLFGLGRKRRARTA
ncbi:MAG: hypothetical protein WC642_15375, partial [Nocardioides sp.]